MSNLSKTEDLHVLNCRKCTLFGLGYFEVWFSNNFLSTFWWENWNLVKINKESLTLKKTYLYQHRTQYKWSIDWFDLWYGLTHTIRHFSSYIAKVLCVKCNLKNLEWLPVQFESIHPSAISVYSKNDTFPLCTIFLNFWVVSENVEIFDAF